MSEQMDFSQVDMALTGYLPQMQRDLLALLSMPTLKAEAEAEAPFGPQLAEALDYCLAVAASLGLAVRNIDGYCGIADLEGGGPEQLGLLSHVDVVPAQAEDWQSPPFDPEIRDGKIYGRGALDDKGPLIASLYAVAVLGDCGIPLEKTVRLIFGCDEESGMSCMRYYLSQLPPPDISFSPDGAFPVIMGEKGILHFSLDAAWPQADTEPEAPLTLLSLNAGTAANIVPAAAEAVFRALPAAQIPVASLPPGVTLASSSGGLLTVSAEGRACHASTPEAGENALAKLIAYLAGLDFAPSGAQRMIRQLAELTADANYGAGFGLADADQHSRLTLVPSRLDIDGAGGSLGCDMRLPISKGSAHYLPRLEQAAASRGLSFRAGFCQEPLFLGEEHPLVQTLLEVYREVSGDQAARPLVQGGGTYAKTMPNCLAFGPELPGQPSLAHQVDEAIGIDHLLQLAKIYARAVYRLAK